MGLWIEEYLALQTCGGSHFNLQGIFPAHLCMTDEGNTQFVLFGIDEVRIVVLARCFELSALWSNQRLQRGGVLVPRGLPVVRFDGGSIAVDEFGVVAIGLLGNECVGAGLFVHGV